MNECPFETEVLDAIASHRWPARADEALRAHVAACADCRDLADTAGALLHEHDAAYAEARVPSAALVWHRAQLRAHEDAVRMAARPLGFIQGAAVACGIAVVLALAATTLPLVSNWLPSMPTLRMRGFAAPDIDLLALVSNTTVQIALAGWLLLAPVAAYLAFSRD